MAADKSGHTVRLATGYQMAYARWVTLRHGRAAKYCTFFGSWAQMQGQLNNPRPYLLTDDRSVTP